MAKLHAFELFLPPSEEYLECSETLVVTHPAACRTYDRISAVPITRSWKYSLLVVCSTSVRDPKNFGLPFQLYLQPACLFHLIRC